MKIYNSIDKKIEKFEPIEKEKVMMYVCGLSPYDKAHIGHARTYASFDIIKRYLISKGYKVYHLQNITDIEDKIIKRAEQLKRNPIELCDEHNKRAMELFKELNILEADVYPKVSNHIPEITSMIKKIIKNKYAYQAEDGVYFDVQKFKKYGELSGQKLKKTKTGTREIKGKGAKNPMDFALWKNEHGIISFDSPWGEGRPGWHIECSAMSMKYAKRTLDIHGGARDLIFPHHENEIAQAEAAEYSPFVKYWVHTGFLTVNGEKMSKSLGNFVTVEDILKKFNPNGVRLFFAQAHYRSPIDYEEEKIKAAEKTAERILRTQEELKNVTGKGKKNKKKFENHVNKFYDAMDTDFDTPGALAALFEIIREINHLKEKGELSEEDAKYAAGELKEMFWILGLKPEEKNIDSKKELIIGIAEEYGLEYKGRKAEEVLNIIIDERESARDKKDYGKSDEIRAKLKGIGIVIEDNKEKQKWRIE